MRTGEWAVLTINIILLAFAAVSYILLPDAAAGHWGTDTGDAGRYLVFLLPLLSVLVSSMTLLASRVYRGWDPEDGETVYHAMLLTDFAVAGVCFIGVGIVVGYNL